MRKLFIVLALCMLPTLALAQEPTPPPTPLFSMERVSLSARAGLQWNGTDSRYFAGAQASYALGRKVTLAFAADVPFTISAFDATLNSESVGDVQYRLGLSVNLYRGKK